MNPRWFCGIIGKMKKVVSVLKRFPVSFAYLFGSSVKRKRGKLSDLDLAVFLKEKVKPKSYFKVRLEILNRLGREIPQEKFDLVILNDCSPLLAQMVVAFGKLIFCQDKNRQVGFVVKTLKTYDDAIFLKKTFYHYLEKRVENKQFGEVAYEKT